MTKNLIVIDRIVTYFLSHSFDASELEYWLFLRRKNTSENKWIDRQQLERKPGIFDCVNMDSAARLSLQCSLFSSKQNHLDVCPLFPVKCPNMCGKMEVPREKVLLTNRNLF